MGMNQQLEPMELRGQLRGRVGTRRHLIQKTGCFANARQPVFVMLLILTVEA